MSYEAERGLDGWESGGITEEIDVLSLASALSDAEDRLAKYVFTAKDEEAEDALFGCLANYVDTVNGYEDLELNFQGLGWTFEGGSASYGQVLINPLPVKLPETEEVDRFSVLNFVVAPDVEGRYRLFAVGLSESKLAKSIASGKKTTPEDYTYCRLSSALNMRMHGIVSDDWSG